MNEGAKFFDSNELFDRYQSGRHRFDSPNESLEKPIILELIGDVHDRRILDLGCGDGNFGLEMINANCKSYIGLESSINMVRITKETLRDTIGQIEYTKIEDWDFPVESFDLVVSRLALHYISNLEETFHSVNKTLKKDGCFVFSVVHPVITSSDKSREKSGIRKDWIVDNYFATGSRKVRFMGEFVEQYHRTIEDIFKSMQKADFVVEQLRESRPLPENFEDEDLYERRKRIPLFIFFSGRKI